MRSDALMQHGFVIEAREVRDVEIRVAAEPIQLDRQHTTESVEHVEQPQAVFGVDDWRIAGSMVRDRSPAPGFDRG
jgi:hypothetical protein